MIERKIVAGQLLRAFGHEQFFPALLHIHRPVADRTQPAGALSHPMKYLPALQREREIEVPRGTRDERGRAHWMK